MDPMTMMALAGLGMQAGGMASSMFGSKDEEKGGMTPEMLNILLGKREYKLDEKAMKRVVDQLNQMRATGQNITPEMYDSLYRAELTTAADTALKKSELGANVAMRSASIGENARQFDAGMEAEGQAGLGSLIGQNLPKMLACMIVTACNGPDSEEVEIAREFRNRFLDIETLRGYYMTADLILPAMGMSKRFAQMVKSALVDSLIEYGKYILEICPVCSDTAKEDTLGFLEVCKSIGRSIPSFTRSTGEVI